METCVLIPQELSLAVTAAGARNSGEQMVSVWSSSRIKQGELYYPFQGTVRIDKLNIYSYIDNEDVSTKNITLIFILLFSCRNQCRVIPFTVINFYHCTTQYYSSEILRARIFHTL